MQPPANANARTGATTKKPATRTSSRTPSPDAGVFTVHHKDEDWFFEIPDSLLGRDMLLISRIAGKMDGLGGFAPAGVATNRQMIRFERRGEQIMLRKNSGVAVADDTLAIAASVEANYFAPILASWDIEARGADSASSVIDVTGLFRRGHPPHLRPQPGAAAHLRRAPARRRPQLHQPHAQLPAERERAPHPHLRRFVPADRRAREHRHDRDEPVAGAPARRADAPALRRSAGRVLLGEPHQLRPRRAEGRHRDLHPPLAAGALRPGGVRARRGGRPRQADHLLRRPGHARALRGRGQARDRELAARLRDRGVQQRDRRAGGPLEG